MPKEKIFLAQDLRAIAKLVAQATQGVTNITQGVHQSVGSGAISGFVYQSVRGVTSVVSTTVDLALAALAPLLATKDPEQLESSARQAVLAALNGVVGDQLHESGNALATPMTIRFAPRSANAPPNGNLLVMIHGLCMNDLQWKDSGNILAAQLGLTPVYLRYNTGKHIFENGQELALQFEALLAKWPVPIESINILAHSMGGLVSKAAMHVGLSQGQRWPALLHKVVFLGTPHQGAPLERIGNWLDLLLGSTPYTRPFTKLAQLRSAGITDLRYGTVLPDGQPRVPKATKLYYVGGATAAKRGFVADHLLGDGLVPLSSALGKSRNFIAYETNHMQLPHSPMVHTQVVKWFTAKTVPKP